MNQHQSRTGPTLSRRLWVLVVVSLLPLALVVATSHRAVACHETFGAVGNVAQLAQEGCRADGVKGGSNEPPDYSGPQGSGGSTTTTFGGSTTTIPTSGPCEEAEPPDGQHPLGPQHHIATDKNPPPGSDRPGYAGSDGSGPYTPKLKPFFDNADLDITNEPANQVRIPGHKGPHPTAYHRAVFDALTDGVKDLANPAQDLAPHTPAYTEAVKVALELLKNELLREGSLLNEMIKNPSWLC